MKDFIKKRKGELEEYLKDLEENENIEINYMLYNKEKDDILAFVTCGFDKALLINSKNEIINIPEWDFSFDEYLFEYLESEYEIEFMEDYVHTGIINEIEKCRDDIINEDGVEKYLVYCLENNITKEYLFDKLKVEVADINKLFIPMDDFATFEYKGFTCAISGRNFENNEEAIVNIYKNYQDYIAGDVYDTVPINEKGLKTYTKRYINEDLLENENINKEKQYLTFVLGYDILNKMLSNSNTPECDISYDFCKKIVDEFVVNTKEYSESRKQTYTLLYDWVEENKDKIEKEHNNFIKNEELKSKRKEIKKANKEGRSR